MAKFNLKKKAQEYVINEKQLEENRKNTNIDNESQGVVNKNINLSMTVKNKDNTVPFNTQLDEMRKKEDKQQIIEADMDDKIVDFKDGDKKQVMDINVKSQEYDTKKGKDYKEAEEKSKMDTDFWDRYVGVQLEGKMKKIDNNIPATASQLPNKVERFKKEEPTKMIMASLKDADAMLLHIHAKANSQNRELTEKEKQQVIDINSGKMRLIAQMIQPIKRSLEYSSNDPIIRKERDGTAVVYDKEKAIDKFKSCGEAKANYPEADEEN